jgi:hypothetical protein
LNWLDGEAGRHVAVDEYAARKARDARAGLLVAPALANGAARSCSARRAQAGAPETCEDRVERGKRMVRGEGWGWTVLRGIDALRERRPSTRRLPIRESEVRVPRRRARRTPRTPRAPSARADPSRDAAAAAPPQCAQDAVRRPGPLPGVACGPAGRTAAGRGPAGPRASHRRRRLHLETLGGPTRVAGPVRRAGPRRRAGSAPRGSAMARLGSVPRSPGSAAATLADGAMARPAHSAEVRNPAMARPEPTARWRDPSRKRAMAQRPLPQARVRASGARHRAISSDHRAISAPIESARWSDRRRSRGAPSFAADARPGPFRPGPARPASPGRLRTGT